MATTARLLTIDDLHAMPDDGRRYELIDGVIVVSPAPSLAHQTVSKRLLQLVLPFETVHNLGWVFYAPVEVRLSPSAVVQPDLLFVSRARASVLRSTHVDGPPDLVVEILSTSTRHRDLGEKLAVYEAAGVLEYWLADPQNHRFFAYALKNGRFEPIPQTGAIVRSVVLPGLEIDVTALFANLA